MADITSPSSQANGPSTPAPAPTPAAAPSAPIVDDLPADPEFAGLSTDDDPKSKRPKDARLIHMVLASLGVQAYQERVPLQLMDFAYRYTSGILQDALHFASEGYTGSGTGRSKAGADESGSVNLAALKLAIASRTQYQFNPALPKEYFLELASERNKIALPPVGPQAGLRLPPERYCLTGVGFSLKDEWDDNGFEAAEEGDVDMLGTANDLDGAAANADVTMNDEDPDLGELGEGDDEAMEDLFGGDADDEKDAE